MDRKWRIGHFPRSLPDGYLETLASNENKISNPDLAQFYDKLSVLTRDPVFSIQRFKEILMMNWGSYDELLQRYDERVRDYRPGTSRNRVESGK